MLIPRYGGYSSLFHAGLSRRPAIARTRKFRERSQQTIPLFDDNYLPSWCPDLRLSTEEWTPVFTSDHAASTPNHYIACNVRHRANPGPMMIRGHRIDSINMGFRIAHPIEPCQKVEHLVDFRRTIKLFLALRAIYRPYPTGQTWAEALGFALMTAMPSGPNELDHPFQRYVGFWNLDIQLDNGRLKKIWQTYLQEFIDDAGAIWAKFRSYLSQLLERRRMKNHEKLTFDPALELSFDHHLAWLLHKFLGDVLQKHRFVITCQGYMGLAPPDSIPGDVVVVFGGPGTPFVIRDLPVTALAELEAESFNPRLESTDANHVRTVPSESGTRMSELRGPCYLQGVMDGELFQQERYKTELEWEGNYPFVFPKPTICLV